MCMHILRSLAGRRMATAGWLGGTQPRSGWRAGLRGMSLSSDVRTRRARRKAALSGRHSTIGMAPLYVDRPLEIPRSSSSLSYAGPEPEPEPDRVLPGSAEDISFGPDLNRLLGLAWQDVPPTMSPFLHAMEVVDQVLVLQCVYYTQMFLVLREKTLQSRITLASKRKRNIATRISGTGHRQDDYMRKREAMMAQFGLDATSEEDAQQMAQVRILTGFVATGLF